MISEAILAILRQSVLLVTSVPLPRGFVLLLYMWNAFPPFLATIKEWFFVSGVVRHQSFSYSCIVKFNVMYYYYSIAYIHQLADYTLLNKLFHFECSC